MNKFHSNSIDLSLFRRFDWRWKEVYEIREDEQSALDEENEQGVWYGCVKDEVRMKVYLVKMIKTCVSVFMPVFSFSYQKLRTLVHLEHTLESSWWFSHIEWTIMKIIFFLLDYITYTIFFSLCPLINPSLISRTEWVVNTNPMVIRMIKFHFDSAFVFLFRGTYWTWKRGRWKCY